MSSLAWIDFDEAERQRALRIMALLDEREGRRPRRGFSSSRTPLVHDRARRRTSSIYRSGTTRPSRGRASPSRRKIPGASGWAVIQTFCLDVQQVRRKARGCFLATIPAQPRRPCRLRHPYAVPRTSLQCVCTRRRNCIEQLSPSSEYALEIGPIPARPAATIKLTHYRSGVFVV